MLTGEGSALMGQLGELEGELEASLRWMLRDDVDITGVICETFSVAAPDPIPIIEDKNPINDNSNNNNSNKEGRMDAESKEGVEQKKGRVVAVCNGGGTECPTEHTKYYLIQIDRVYIMIFHSSMTSRCRYDFTFMSRHHYLEDREVTNENKAEYVQLLLQWRTCYSVASVMLPFLQVGVTVTLDTLYL